MVEGRSPERRSSATLANPPTGPSTPVALEPVEELALDALAEDPHLRTPAQIGHLVEWLMANVSFRANVELDRLAAVVTLIELPKSGVLFNQGDPGDAYYIVFSGAIGMHLAQHDGAGAGAGAPRHIKQEVAAHGPLMMGRWKKAGRRASVVGALPGESVAAKAAAALAAKAEAEAEAPEAAPPQRERRRISFLQMEAAVLEDPAYKAAAAQAAAVAKAAKMFEEKKEAELKAAQGAPSRDGSFNRAREGGSFTRGDGGSFISRTREGGGVLGEAAAPPPASRQPRSETPTPGGFDRHSSNRRGSFEGRVAAGETLEQAMMLPEEGESDGDEECADGPESAPSWWGPCLSIMRTGSAFGELALLQGGKRSLSAIARTELQLVRVSRDHYLSLIATAGEEAAGQMRMALLRDALPCCNDWNESRMQRLCYIFAENSPGVGAKLQREGQRPASLWLVVEGEVIVELKPEGGTRPVQVARCGRGVLLGEIDHESEVCSTSLVVASSPCRLLVAPLERFFSVLGNEKAGAESAFQEQLGLWREMGLKHLGTAAATAAAAAALSPNSRLLRQGRGKGKAAAPALPLAPSTRPRERISRRPRLKSPGAAVERVNWDAELKRYVSSVDANLEAAPAAAAFCFGGTGGGAGGGSGADRPDNVRHPVGGGVETLRLNAGGGGAGGARPPVQSIQLGAPSLPAIGNAAALNEFREQQRLKKLHEQQQAEQQRDTFAALFGVLDPLRPKGVATAPIGSLVTLPGAGIVTASYQRAGPDRLGVTANHGAQTERAPRRPRGPGIRSVVTQRRSQLLDGLIHDHSLRPDGGSLSARGADSRDESLPRIPLAKPGSPLRRLDEEVLICALSDPRQVFALATSRHTGLSRLGKRPGRGGGGGGGDGGGGGGGDGTAAGLFG